VAAPQNDYADKFARLAQLDKAQRTKNAEIKARAKELETREASIKEKLELAEMIEKDPLSVLKKRGVDIHKLYSDSLTQIELEDDPVRKELAELRAWRDNFEKTKVDE
jgi:hypothetical protein